MSNLFDNFNLLTNIQYHLIYLTNTMGKGDIKTKRGKIFNGTFGVSRPHKVKVVPVVATKKKKTTAKKKAAK